MIYSSAREERGLKEPLCCLLFCAVKEICPSEQNTAPTSFFQQLYFEQQSLIWRKVFDLSVAWCLQTTQNATNRMPRYDLKTERLAFIGKGKHRLGSTNPRLPGSRQPHLLLTSLRFVFPEQRGSVCKLNPNALAHTICLNSPGNGVAREWKTVTICGPPKHFLFQLNRF